MRTQAEIRARFDAIRRGDEHVPDDWAGFRQVALAEAMEFDTVRDLLKDPGTRRDWQQPEVAAQARDYLVFAIGKAVDHRGISASRSIEKLTEWLWCLDVDELRIRFEQAAYPQYGAPKLQVLVDAWKVDHPYAGDGAWQRMVRGEHCSDDCAMGCGL